MMPSPMASTGFTFKNLIHRTLVEQNMIQHDLYNPIRSSFCGLSTPLNHEQLYYSTEHQGKSSFLDKGHHLYTFPFVFSVFVVHRWRAAPSLDTTSPKFPEAWSRTWLCTLWTSSFAPVWSWKLLTVLSQQVQQGGGWASKTTGNRIHKRCLKGSISIAQLL